MTIILFNCCDRIVRDEFDQFSNDIIKLFPNESKVLILSKSFVFVVKHHAVLLVINLHWSFVQATWFEVVKGKKGSTVCGRLRNKYYSVRRTLVNAQLIDKEDLLEDLEASEPIDEGEFYFFCFLFFFK